MTTRRGLLQQLGNHILDNGAEGSSNYTESMGAFYDQSFPKDIDGKEYDASSLKGKVVLVTNVACK